MSWQDLFSEPIQDMWSKLLSFVPNLIGALAVLILGWIVAQLIQVAVERLLKMARFDSLTDRAGINQALQQGKIRQAPSGIMARLFFWIVMLLALAIAVNVLQLEVASQMLYRLVYYVPNVIVAAFILALGFFFGGLVRGFVATMAGSLRAVDPQTLGKIAQAAVILFAVAASLEQLRIATQIIVNAFTAVFGALALGFALAFGLGCKDIVKSWVEGVIRK